MVKEGLHIVAVLTSRWSYHILLALNITDGDENVLHYGHLCVCVMSTFYSRESILIGVDGSRLLRFHDVISIYILLGIFNLDVVMTITTRLIAEIIMIYFSYFIWNGP